jgi:hypothetical protein
VAWLWTLFTFSHDCGARDTAAPMATLSCLICVFLHIESILLSLVLSLLLLQYPSLT